MQHLLRRRPRFAAVATIAAIAASSLLATSASAQAGPPGAGPGLNAPGGAGPAPGGLPYLDGLDLSEAQQDQVFAILHAQAPRRRALDQAGRAARRALRALAGQARFDEAAAAAAAQALGQAIADGEMLRLATGAQLMAVLTPQQRAQLDARRGDRQRGDGAHRDQRLDRQRSRHGDEQPNDGGAAGQRGGA